MMQPWTLASGQADVWYLAVDGEKDAGAHDRWWRLLSQAERERASRFVSPADRDRFVLAHAALRIVLSHYTGIAPARLNFAANAYGRPELVTSVEEPRLRFNLSHTHGLIAVAVCRRYYIGVDVECALGPSENLLDVAARFFSPLETAVLGRLPSGERGRRFLQIWTLKEAYVKARGLGLSMPLDAFSFDFGNDSTPAIRIDPSLRDDAGAWRFLQVQPTPHHWLAAAVRADHDDPCVAIGKITPAELLGMAS